MALKCDDLTLTCTLDADALAKRCEELSKGILAEATEIVQLANGLRWRFASRRDLLTRLGPLLDAERQCCRFLTITLHTEPNLGDIVLDITGPNGTRELLTGWLRQ